MTIKEQIWQMVYDQTPEGSHDKIKHNLKGTTYWNQEVQDIVDSIDDLASAIEDAINEEWKDKQESKKGE